MYELYSCRLDAGHSQRIKEIENGKLKALHLFGALCPQRTHKGRHWFLSAFAFYFLSFVCSCYFWFHWVSFISSSFFRSPASFWSSIEVRTKWNWQTLNELNGRMAFASFPYRLQRNDPHSPAQPIRLHMATNRVTELQFSNREWIALPLNSVNIFDMIFVRLCKPLHIIRQ